MSCNARHAYLISSTQCHQDRNNTLLSTHSPSGHHRFGLNLRDRHCSNPDVTRQYRLGHPESSQRGLRPPSKPPPNPRLFPHLPTAANSLLSSPSPRCLVSPSPSTSPTSTTPTRTP